MTGNTGSSTIEDSVELKRLTQTFEQKNACPGVGGWEYDKSKQTEKEPELHGQKRVAKFAGAGS